MIRKKDTVQNEKWLQAIKKVNVDKKDWMPSEHSRICNQHFVSGHPSIETNHPDYVPTIFETKYIKAKTENDVARAERSKKRLLKTSTGILVEFVI